MTETIGFSIEGEFITNLARQWFWDENKDYEVVEELLLNCLITDEISLEERKSIVQSIIEGKKKLVGINSFSLEDDMVLVRPIYQKINELKDKAKIKEIEDDMQYNTLNYIDIYSIEKPMDEIEYDINELNKNYSYYDIFFYFATKDGNCDSEYLKGMEKSTKAGLWLLDNPKIVFKAFGKKVTKDNKEEFFEKLYEYLLENDTSNKYKERQKRYEQFKRVDLSFTNSKLPKWEEEDYRFASTDINYYKKPDDLIEEYGWINRYGEWYSCDFGGHRCKAETIVECNEKILKDYENWLNEKGTYETKKRTFQNGDEYEMTEWSVLLYTNNNFKVYGDDLYEEFLLQKGWVKFHNPYGGECYPTNYLKPTKEQLDTMFRQSIKQGYKKIQGLDIED